MLQQVIIRVAVLATAALLWVGSIPAKDIVEKKVNVLLILVDDLGVETLKCYSGASYNTPFIDKLAEESLVFERAFATPVCTPTRAQLLTGLYPAIP
ncbi:MAG: arylsulfatase A [Verrucomicrobiales bacterium]|jgi:arylsulfatase A